MHNRTLWVCALGAVLSACSLVNAPDEIVTTAQGGSGGAGAGATGGGGAAPECTDASQCSQLDGECVLGACDNGTCVTTPRGVEVACGAAPSGDCDAPNHCDGAGQCLEVLAPDGSNCNECAGGPGTCGGCEAGVCGECGSRATTKTFGTPLALSGWTVNGGWRVFTEAPPTGFTEPVSPAIPFATPVLGTDGNRRAPYPGYEVEVSTAETPAFIIPPTIDFYSWNVDEGFQYDSKSILLSVDGGGFQVIAICPEDASSPIPYAFCNPVATTRDPNAWDFIQIPVPPNAVGKTGVLRFAYLNQDYLFGTERGWFIDRLNIATECGCATATDCAFLDSGCADGACDAATAECHLSPKNVGSSCTADGVAECSAADTCSAFGLCDPGLLAVDGQSCTSCDAGAGNCLGCGLGECVSCKDEQDFGRALGVDSTAGLAAKGWTLTGDWGIYQGAPPCSTDAAFLDFSEPGEMFFFQYVLGSDGARISAAPPGAEQSNGHAVTSPTVIPAQLTFQSWHQDRGGPLGRDNKTINVSVDNGQTWTTIADCTSDASLPFCVDYTSLPNRARTDWDSVTIDIPAALVGQTGIFEFAYNTFDTGSVTGFERGWYIDKLNINRCD
ncbi:MAG: hypothetical protein U0271_20775 [Polyangiaceae bacterium]